jgi:dephospho-CoA kinase
VKIGVTGGIGSGKTSVCRVFNVLGIPVFSADSEAKRIMDSDPLVMDQVRSIAGKDVYSRGFLDRSELASIIFNDEKRLGEINKLVHPVIFTNFRKWAEGSQAPYVIMEAAILFESNASESVDKIITVIAPLEERIERVTRRNLLDREQVLERVRNQIDDQYKIKHSDWVINNSENEMIIPAILKIHEEIIEMIKNNN